MTFEELQGWIRSLTWGGKAFLTAAEACEKPLLMRDDL